MLSNGTQAQGQSLTLSPTPYPVLPLDICRVLQGPESKEPHVCVWHVMSMAWHGMVLRVRMKSMGVCPATPGLSLPIGSRIRDVLLERRQRGVSLSSRLGL